MVKTKLNKRGLLNLSDAAPIVIILMTIGIVLTVGLLIIAEVEVQTISSGNLATTAVVGNETHGTIADATAFSVDTVTGVQINRALGSVIVTNATGPAQVVVPDSNYTVDASAGTVTPIAPSNAAFSGGWNVSYTLSETTRSIAINSTQSTQEGINVLASFQSIFGIVVAAAIVLGVITLFR